MAFSRRFAGMRMAAEPLVDVTPQLQKLKEKGAALEGDATAKQQQAYLRDKFNVGRNEIDITASPLNNPLSLDIQEGREYFGNKETYDLLAEGQPNREYNLAFSVNDAFSEDDRMPRLEKIQIARETQRRFKVLAERMEEGTVVSNSPVGAGQGDYGRADLYMANGFGPLQENGSQYGIIKEGKIVPLSPFAPLKDHVRHLAKKTRMAGDERMSEKLLKQLASTEEIIPKTVAQSEDRTRFLADEAKPRGAYESDDYGGDYYDEDYEPAPRRPLSFAQVGDELKNTAAPEYTAPEIAGRRYVEAINRSPGLSPDGTLETLINTNGSRILGNDPNVRVSTVPPEQVQRLRDWQVNQYEFGQSVDDNNNRILDELNRRYPRQTPRLITARDLELGRQEEARRIESYGWGGPPDPRRQIVPDLAETPPEERVAFMADVIRDNMVEDSARGFYPYSRRPASGPLDILYGGSYGGPSPGIDQLKPLMQSSSPDPVVRPGESRAYINNELLSPEDVQMFRDLQVQQALSGNLRPVERQVNRSPLPNYVEGLEESLPDEGFPRRRRVESQSPGTMVRDRVRDLTSDQQSAVDELDRLLGQAYDGQSGAELASGAERFLRRLDPTNADLLMSRPPAEPMSERRMMRLLEAGARQPGRFENTEIGEAINQFRSSTAISSDRLNELAAIADTTFRDPTPSRVRTLSGPQLTQTVEIPGVGPLNRPNSPMAILDSQSPGFERRIERISRPISSNSFGNNVGPAPRRGGWNSEAARQGFGVPYPTDDDALASWEASAGRRLASQEEAIPPAPTAPPAARRPNVYRDGSGYITDGQTPLALQRPGPMEAEEQIILGNRVSPQSARWAMDSLRTVPDPDDIPF